MPIRRYLIRIRCHRLGQRPSLGELSCIWTRITPNNPGAECLRRVQDGKSLLTGYLHCADKIPCLRRARVPETAGCPRRSGMPHKPRIYLETELSPFMIMPGFLIVLMRSWDISDSVRGKLRVFLGFEARFWIKNCALTKLLLSKRLP
jgi:hypothetical protein